MSLNHYLTKSFNRLVLDQRDESWEGSNNNFKRKTKSSFGDLQFECPWYRFFNINKLRLVFCPINLTDLKKLSIFLKIIIYVFYKNFNSSQLKRTFYLIPKKT